MNSLPRCSASCLASSVLPTPVGPVNRKQPAGRSGWPRPARERLIARATSLHRVVLAEDHAPQRLLERPQAIPVGRRGLLGGDAGHARDDLLDLAAVISTAAVRRRRLEPGAPRAVTACASGSAAAARRRAAAPRAEPRLRARFVEHVDGAVGQPVVAQVARRQLRGRLERVVRVARRGDAPRSASAGPAGSGRSPAIDRLVDGDLLQPPRERAVLLDVLELLVRRRADDAELAGREDRLDQRRQIHRAAGGRAGADGGVDLVDEQDRHRALGERVDDRLEALLEVAAEPRAGEQRAGVEREDLGALRAPPARRPAAAACASPSASAVLPTPASPTNTGLFLRRRQRISIVRCSSVDAADQRIEHAACAPAR